MSPLRSLLVACAIGFAHAGPIGPRVVSSLDEAAFEEAQQRDDTATRAFSNVQIKTSDGQCLFVDKLSGDFRANLTPIQVGTCGATDGQGFDIITAGKHNDQPGTMLVVSTLTQACMNFDPRRAAGNQVLLFSCGGRADGGGQVTNSQLFTFSGGAGPLSLEPLNQAGSCFTVKGNVLDVAQCSSGDAKQSFTIGDGAGDAKATASSATEAATTTAAGETATTVAATATTAEEAATTTASQETGETTTADSKSSSGTCSPRTRTVTVPPSTSSAGENTPGNQEATVAPSATEASSTEITSSSATTSSTDSTITSSPPTTTTTTGSSGNSGNPTSPIPVSRAGGVLNPSAAAESNQRDDTATRAFADVEIRAPNGQCLSVDPTAGDFRQNLIPVALVDCAGTDGEKWDVITAGKHNNAKGAVIIVSSLTQGCISFDGRRPAGDTVTLFSCGGRADGGGETNAGQLIPFIGATSFAFAPESENNKTCILPGDAGRLDSGPCPTEVGPQLFSIFPA